MSVVRTRGGLPVRRYVATLVGSVVGFLALSILDQRELFFTAWGLGEPAAPATVSPGDESGARRAERAVRSFNAAVEAACAGRGTAALDAVPLSPELRAELSEALADPTTGSLTAGLRLGDFAVLRVEPRPPSGWEVTTDESWSSPRSRSRLRFRYRLSSADGGLQVDAMTPLLPEPVSDPTR